MIDGTVLTYTSGNLGEYARADMETWLIIAFTVLDSGYSIS